MNFSSIRHRSSPPRPNPAATLKAHAQQTAYKGGDRRLRKVRADILAAVEADVQHFGAGLEPFDFVFDRGCYHCCRGVDLEGYRATLRHVTRPGTLFLCLAGNANEQSDEGPPRVTEEQIREELGELFEIEQLREFRFQDPGGEDGPLGWSCLMVRRARDPVTG